MRNEKGSASSTILGWVLSGIALAIGLFAKYVLWQAILKMHQGINELARWAGRQVKARIHAFIERNRKKKQLEFNTDLLPYPKRFR